MFQFPALAPYGDVSSTRRVAPFGNLRVIARLPALRSLSQAPTSFIASWCQGIHHAPFSVWTLNIDAWDLNPPRARAHFGSRALLSDTCGASPARRKRQEGFAHSVNHHSYTKSFQRDSAPHLSVASDLWRTGSIHVIHQPWACVRRHLLWLLKGGDPAAGSPTATLLRLHPNRWPYRGQLPPEG